MTDSKGTADLVTDMISPQSAEITRSTPRRPSNRQLTIAAESSLTSRSLHLRCMFQKESPLLQGGEDVN
jgi:hypothetical protein